MITPVWAIKLPWVEVVIGPKGKMTKVKCKICSEVEKKKENCWFLSSMDYKNMQVVKKEHLHVQRWLLVNTTLGTLANMLRMNNNMLRLMGELLWLNKLQNGDLKEHKRKFE